MNYRLLFDKKNWLKLIYLYWNNSNNLKYEQSYNQSDSETPVIGFYHVFCMIDGWEDLVSEQLLHIVNSGLYNRIQTLYCGVLIQENNKDKFEAFVLKYDKIIFDKIMYYTQR